MTILVDFDDTLIDLLKPWCEALNKKAHTKVKPDDIKSWDICSYFPTLTRKEIFEPLDKPSMWKKVQIKLNADKVLKKLIDDGVIEKLGNAKATFKQLFVEQFKQAVKNF